MWNVSEIVMPLSVALICILILFSAIRAMSRIVRLSILLHKRAQIEHRLRELNEMISELKVTNCELETLADGTLLLYAAKDGTFLAQGQGLDQIRTHLAERFGVGRHYIWAGGNIDT